MSTLNQAFFRLTIGQDTAHEISFSDRIGKNRIQSVELDLNEKKLHSVKISIVDLKKDVLDHEYLQENHPIVFQFGIKNVWSRERKFIIKEIDTTYEKSIKAQITGLDQRSAAVFKKSGKVWANKTAAQIVEEICGVFGWDPKGVQKTKTVHPFVSSAHKSFSQVIADLAWLENYSFYVEDNVCYFKPAYDLTNRKVHTYNWWVSKVPNITKFSIKTKSSENSAHGAGVHGTHVDAKTGEIKKVESGEGPTVPGGKRIVAATYRAGGGYATELKIKKPDAVDSHPSAQEERATAKKTEAVWRTSEAQLEVYNTPIEIEDVINVKGVALKHEGLYRVTQIQMKINGGTIKSSVKLSRDITRTKHGHKAEDEHKTPNNPEATNAGPPRPKVTYKPGGGYSVAHGK